MSIAQNLLPIVIPAYQKPEKLVQRYEEVIDWPRLSQLYISIDAPRSTAKENETKRNHSVLKVAEALAEKNSRVQLLVWNKNLGGNQLLANIIRATIGHPGLIVIEDDVAVSHATLNFLADNYNRAGSKAATGYVKREHSGFPTTANRVSVFPFQWGVAFNADVMAMYLDIHESGNFKRRVVKDTFEKHFMGILGSVQLEKLTQWWFNHFYFCHQHRNWGDAVLQYAVYASGGFYRVPAVNLIEDDNELFDERSTNPRTRFEPKIFCEFGKMIDNSLDYICFKCELEGSHMNEARLRNLIGATKHRRYTQLRSKVT